MSVTLGRINTVAAVSRPVTARAAIIVGLLAGAATGIVVGAQEAPVQDVDLLRLLRAMAVLKLAFVAAAAGAVLWRLQAPVRPAWLAGYAAVCFALAAGPSLIWYSSHIVLASILLHGGLAAAMILLWREGATSDLLHVIVARRRAALRDG